MRPVPAIDEIRSIGVEAGLDAVGIAGAEPFASTRADLEERASVGISGGMQFTYRRPARSTDPAAALRGAEALVVGARRYPAGAGPPPTTLPPTTEPAGRVAAYAREDHYGALRDGLAAVATRLEADGWRTRVVADDNALVDREAAVRAGLGWYGKNSNVLLPGSGSWFVLGSVITDAPLEPSAPVPDGCGRCRRCLDGCPTGAIVAPGVVDARRCLAWLVQAPGSIPERFRSALGDRMYGCDDCQEVCPPNRREEAAASGGWVSVLEVLEASDEELLRDHGRWYIPERDPRYLRRNALVVLGNVGRVDDERVLASLRRYLDDPDPMLREHAGWAARALGMEIP